MTWIILTNMSKWLWHFQFHRENLVYAITWMKLEDVTLSEMAVSERNSAWFHFIRHLKTVTSQKLEWWFPGAKERAKGSCSRGLEFVLQDEKVLLHNQVYVLYSYTVNMTHFVRCNFNHQNNNRKST